MKMSNDADFCPMCNSTKIVTHISENPIESDKVQAFSTCAECMTEWTMNFILVETVVTSAGLSDFQRAFIDSHTLHFDFATPEQIADYFLKSNKSVDSYDDTDWKINDAWNLWNDACLFAGKQHD